MSEPSRRRRRAWMRIAGGLCKGGVAVATLATATLAAATGAHAQEALRSGDRDAPLERVVARAMIDVLPDVDAAVFARSWYAVGVRAQRIRWHLADPADPERLKEPFGVRRTGWIPAGGRSASVVLCGDEETARAVGVRLSVGIAAPEAPGAAPPSALVQALAAEGVMLVTEQAEARGPLADDAYAADMVIGAERYRLTVPGRPPTRLWSEHRCTSPQSRAAQRCWSDYLLAVDPEVNDAAGPGPGPAGRNAAAVMATCRVPGRG